MFGERAETLGLIERLSECQLGASALQKEKREREAPENCSPELTGYLVEGGILGFLWVYHFFIYNFISTDHCIVKSSRSYTFLA